MPPPRPDFHCFVDGREILIELGEILESTLAQGLRSPGNKQRQRWRAQLQGGQTKANSIVTMGARALPANQSLEKILRQKLANCYETEGVRSELILFYDRQTPYGPVEYLIQWEAEWTELLRASVFDGVWIFHLPSNQVISRLRIADHGTLQVNHDVSFSFDTMAPFDALVPGDEHGSDEIKRFVPALTMG